MGWAERENPRALINGAKYKKAPERKAITINPLKKMFPDPFAEATGMIASLRLRKNKKRKK